MDPYRRRSSIPGSNGRQIWAVCHGLKFGRAARRPVGRTAGSSGPVFGSIVGVQKYVYDIFGPGVNLAARMESLSETMRTTMSEATYELGKDDFVCTERGEFDAKGFGKINLYFLDRELQRSR